MPEKLYRKECVEVTCECIHTTASSLKVQTDSGKFWIPKKFVHPDSDVQVEGDEGILICAEWVAKKEGLV